MLTQKVIIHPKEVKIYSKRDHSLQNRVIPVFFIESIYALLSSYRYIHQSARISQCQRCPIINCCKDWMNDEIKPSSDTKKKKQEEKKARKTEKLRTNLQLSLCSVQAFFWHSGPQKAAMPHLHQVLLLQTFITCHLSWNIAMYWARSPEKQNRQQIIGTGLPI